MHRKPLKLLKKEGVEKDMTQELIGATIEILQATNKGLEGKKGKLIDETKNTITIETERGEKKILKRGMVIKVLGEKGKEKIIEEDELLKRPYERFK